MNTALDVLANWRRVGSGDSTIVVDARLQLHHAVQIIVSAPISFLQPRADDSHTNLEWLPRFGALGTNWLEGPTRLRFALQPANLALLAINADDQVLSEFSLDGRTVDEAVSWLRESLASAGYEGAALTTKKHYEIPLHRVAAGRPFAFDPPEAFAELAAYYANAHELTSYIATVRAGASAPRCWPHHFDLATLITLPQIEGRATRTIGVGLSPGDDSYSEPYFYIGPYPHPQVERLKPLTLGRWHSTGWIGAVLRGSDLARLGTAEQQRHATLTFANEGIEASMEALA